MTERSPIRGASRKLLLAGIVVCLALAWWRPWDDRPTEERLRSRLSAYTELRKQDDWVALYQMVHPEEREAVGLERFLAFYGQGATRLLGLSVLALAGDAAAGEVSVKVRIRHRLIPERLPASARRGLRVDDESALEQTVESALDWVWHDGDWYFRLDRVVLTARDSTGRPARAVGR